MKIIFLNYLPKHIKIIFIILCRKFIHEKNNNNLGLKIPSHKFPGFASHCSTILDMLLPNCSQPKLNICLMQNIFLHSSTRASEWVREYEKPICHCKRIANMHFDSFESSISFVQCAWCTHTREREMSDDDDDDDEEDTSESHKTRQLNIIIEIKLNVCQIYCYCCCFMHANSIFYIKCINFSNLYFKQIKNGRREWRERVDGHIFNIYVLSSSSSWCVKSETYFDNFVKKILTFFFKKCKQIKKFLKNSQKNLSKSSKWV